MTVLDRHDCVLMIISSEIMDNNFAVAAELAGEAFGYMSSKFKSFIRLHMMLPLSYDALKIIHIHFSNKNFFSQ